MGSAAWNQQHAGRHDMHEILQPTAVPPCIQRSYCCCTPPRRPRAMHDQRSEILLLLYAARRSRIMHDHHRASSRMDHA
eukprot:COSAG05_NODE_175_length_14930_cov_7.138679_2_plen_79_part_00